MLHLVTKLFYLRLLHRILKVAFAHITLTVPSVSDIEYSLSGKNLYFLLLSRQKYVLWQRVYVGNIWWTIILSVLQDNIISPNQLICVYWLLDACCVTCRDIIRGSPDVKWDTIKGLENAKRLLKEAVVMPIKYPQ